MGAFKSESESERLRERYMKICTEAAFRSAGLVSETVPAPVTLGTELLAHERPLLSRHRHLASLPLSTLSFPMILNFSASDPDQPCDVLMLSRSAWSKHSDFQLEPLSWLELRCGKRHRHSSVGLKSSRERDRV